MKSAIAKRLLCVFMAVFFIAGLSWASEEDVIKSILDSRAAVKPFPNPSAKLPGLTVEKAYDMQKNLVKALVQKGDTISGFKGGLTSEAGQKRFGVNDALMGQIFKSGELGPDAVVNSKDFVRLFIETEVGYVIGQKNIRTRQGCGFIEKDDQRGLSCGRASGSPIRRHECSQGTRHHC
jgi:hypothetical protein